MEAAMLIKMFIIAARVTSFSSSSNKRLLGVCTIGAFSVVATSCNFVSYKRKIPNVVNNNNNNNYNVKLYAVVNTRLIVYFICNL